MQNQVIPNGSKVHTEHGVFEVLEYDFVRDQYFCYKKDFDGHSGEAYFGHKYIDTKYEDNCWWFFENEVTLMKESEVSVVKQPKPNYREMQPTDMVKVCIGDNEFEVPLGDLVHDTALLGVANGSYGFRLWEALTKALGEDGFVEDYETVFKFAEKQKQVIDHFFQPHYDKQKQKDELSNLIFPKQEKLSQLIDKLQQM